MLYHKIGWIAVALWAFSSDERWKQQSLSLICNTTNHHINILNSLIITVVQIFFVEHNKIQKQYQIKQIYPILESP